MAFKKLVSKLLIAAWVATPLCQYSSVVNAAELGNANSVKQLDKQGNNKQTKRVSKKENIKALDGSIIQDTTYSDNSRQITISNGDKTDVVEYNPKDGTIKLNGLNQNVSTHTVQKPNGSKTLQNSISSNLSTNSSSGTVWNQISDTDSSLNLGNKTLVQCAALMAAALGITYSNAETASQKYFVATGLALSAIVATGTLSVISVEHITYQDEDNSYRYLEVYIFSYNGGVVFCNQSEEYYL